ncbi:hypothetical protein M8C21_003786, partial [Ambrosia artemisiifolia]
LLMNASIGPSDWKLKSTLVQPIPIRSESKKLSCQHLHLSNTLRPRRLLMLPLFSAVLRHVSKLCLEKIKATVIQALSI